MTIEYVRARLEAAFPAQAWQRADVRALLDDHARLAAEVARLAAALAGYEGKPCGRRDCASARADAREEVERLTKERDVARNDLASALGEYRDGVEADRDRLAAALAEVREAAAEVFISPRRPGGTPRDAAAGERFSAILASIPADIAATHDARVLREAAERADAQAVTSQITADRACEVIRVEGDPSGDISAYMNEADAQANELRRAAYWLRSEAERIERGGR